MATMTIRAATRTVGRKGPSRRLRAAGDIPGVVYGHGIEALPIAIPAAEFNALLRHRSGTMIIDLKLDGAPSEERLTVIREIQREPVTGKVVHLDLQRISLKEKIHVQVPLYITGTAPGVKDESGILEYPLRHLEVKCFPNEIPENFPVDISNLHIGNAIHVRDLTIDPARFELLSEPEMVVVTVSAPRILKTEAEMAAEAAAAVAAEGVVEGAAEAAAEGGEKKEEKGEKGEKAERGEKAEKGKEKAEKGKEKAEKGKEKAEKGKEKGERGKDREKKE